MPTTKKRTQVVINSAHRKFRALKEGRNAEFIPALAEMDPRLFGISLVTVEGEMMGRGDVDVQFTLQSLSKVFALACALRTVGDEAILEKIGADATGQVFNSIMAIEQMKGQEMNPFVNPGAMATTSLVHGVTPEEKWNSIIGIHEAFAGHKLRVNQKVYRSETENNERNRAIAMLMHSYKRLYADPIITTDLYTRQCAISATTSDLAVMAATLACGGRNPVTDKQIIDRSHVQRILAVMATAGLYDDSGLWLYRVGLPAKSGVGGGIIAVAPGRFGIAAFSPPLDHTGNSVRAQKAIQYVAAALSANPYDVQTC